MSRTRKHTPYWVVQEKRGKVEHDHTRIGLTVRRCTSKIESVEYETVYATARQIIRFGYMALESKSGRRLIPCDREQWKQVVQASRDEYGAQMLEHGYVPERWQGSTFEIPCKTVFRRYETREVECAPGEWHSDCRYVWTHDLYSHYAKCHDEWYAPVDDSREVRDYLNGVKKQFNSGVDISDSLW